MPSIKFFIFSCSQDVHCPEPLIVWGSLYLSQAMPDTREEAENRILECRQLTGCKNCDAEIHRIYLNRSRKPGYPYCEEHSRKIGKMA
jgi:hypothetical protein